MAKVVVNEEFCKGCEMCILFCPSKIMALSTERMNSKGYRPAELTDGSKCTGCCACATMCPDIAITVER